MKTSLIGYGLLLALLVAGGCSLFEKVEVKQDTQPVGNYWQDGYCPAPVDGVEQVVSSECRGVDFTGCCDGNGNVLYCYNEQLYCRPCAPEMACSWFTGDEDPYYWCTTSDNGPDPSGTYAMYCDGTGLGTDSGTGDGDADTADTDTNTQTPDGVPVCPVAHPSTCEDIHPTDPDLQIFGCCSANVAYYCDMGEVMFFDCADITGSICAIDWFLWPQGAYCLLPEEISGFNPFDCGGVPSACTDIGVASYEQAFGCCDGDDRWYCDADASSEPIMVPCSPNTCGIAYGEFVDTDSTTYVVGATACK